MKKKKNLLYYTITGAIVLLLVISFASCSGLTKAVSSGFTSIADVITNPTDRELYVRGLKDNPAQLAEWEASYAAAQTDSLQVTLPYGEKGTFIPYKSLAYSYTTDLKEGEVVTATVAQDSVNQHVFITIFAKEEDGLYHIAASNDTNRKQLEYAVALTGRYKVVIQPELAASSNFFVNLSTHPAYIFPVAGKGNTAIGSFWGMERDGGARKHEGIDIFAKRGTPVIAVANGYITYTGEKGLGGKQVWLRDNGPFSKHLYYAHLDSIKVHEGIQVKTGDTLGFVGNTGNARTTPPHLHFGIYRGGAINPLPFVYQTEKVNDKAFARTYTSSLLKTKGKANLRLGPSTSVPVVGTTAANDTLILLGQSNNWLHVQTASGQKAFLNKSLVKPVN